MTHDPSTDKSGDPEVAKLAKQQRDIIQGIGQAAHAWSMLETNLLHLFAALTNDKQLTMETSIIFYTPSNFETRLQMIRRLTDYLFSLSADETSCYLSCIWQKIDQTTNNKKRARNAIFHGSISTSATGKSQQVRLTPPIFDFYEMAIKRKNPQQHPGMSANDIQLFSQSVNVLSKNINSYKTLLIQYKTTGHPLKEADARALNELYLQLCQ